MAEHSRLTANLAAVGLLTALAAGVLIWQQPWAGPADERREAPSIPADARALLTGQFNSLTAARSKADFVRAAGRSAKSRAFAATVWDARARLGARQARFAFEQGGDAVDHPDGTTSARVEVTWTPSDDSILAGSRPASTTVRFRLAPRAHGFDVVSATQVGRDRLPLWLAGPLRVESDGSARVVNVGSASACASVPKTVQAAGAAVQRVLPDATSRLTVVCPDTARTAAALLGRSAADIAQIAAISTALGGPKGSPAIVINPRLFAGMDARARRVIVAHEATHLASGVLGRKVPLWVAEGYADFVALHDDTAPLAVSAGQILGQVRSGGAPRQLPSDADFDESTHGLGAVYESAWMAFRMLADRFGDTAVTGFYRDVVSETSAEEAAKRHFRWTVDELTARWRDYLTKSASTTS